MPGKVDKSAVYAGFDSPIRACAFTVPCALARASDYGKLVRPSCGRTCWTMTPIRARSAQNALPRPTGTPGGRLNLRRVARGPWLAPTLIFVAQPDIEVWISGAFGRLKRARRIVLACQLPVLEAMQGLSLGFSGIPHPSCRRFRGRLRARP
jgi:hypothetical protein